jgi:apolipoprotein N-acyltransferase
MQDGAVAEKLKRERSIAIIISTAAPSLAEVSLVSASALLLILSFPDFDLWPLAWVGLVPLLVAVGRPLKATRAFILGWVWGVIFFYGTCWWLTYPMIHFAHISAWLAYPLFLLPVVVVALFPALFGFVLSRLITRLGARAIFLAPIVWVTLEWSRYAVTGQLWNAVGYSQAFHPWLIQFSRWGGVYAVGFLLLMVNSVMAHALADLRGRASKSALALTAITVVTLLTGFLHSGRTTDPNHTVALVVAVQPNVPMELPDSRVEAELIKRHLMLSQTGLNEWEKRSPDPSNRLMPRLVIWPESPMDFRYSLDSQLQGMVSNLARTYHADVLLNSLEPAPNAGGYNSAVMINQEGRIVAQYDKIRLMPFGEYVPLPHWLPGASSVRSIVGDFTPGSSYTLMPLGALRAGVFICIEAAHPAIARTFTNEGADVLINISNDGYLGPTPVMHQHLANAIFRAVENDRSLIRVTNGGISAMIDRSGRVIEQTPGFEQAVRAWSVNQEPHEMTLYTRYGDLFAYACALMTLGFISATFRTKRRRRNKRRG